jgi:hypothetical protein
MLRVVLQIFQRSQNFTLIIPVFYLEVRFARRRKYTSAKLTNPPNASELKTLQALPDPHARNSHQQHSGGNDKRGDRAAQLLDARYQGALFIRD